MARSALATKIIRLEGRSRGADPLALQAALAEVLRALAKAGAGPAHLSSMIWSGPDPSALHPNRRVVDRIRREILAGFGPPPKVQWEAGDHVTVEAIAEVPTSPPSSQPVYRGYCRMELLQQMTPRAQVPDMDILFAKMAREGDEARLLHQGLDIAYGAHRDEVLDIYRPTGLSKPPVWVFLHGGYWQASSKDQHAQFCQGMVGAGFAVANMDYPLSPETNLQQIITHVRKGLNFLVDQADALGVDASRMHIAGHSAGGHLAAFFACDELAPPLASAHILSGVVDLEPLLHLPVARILGLETIQQAHSLSPVHMRPRHGTRIAIAVGGAESDEFKRQTQELAGVWKTNPVLILPGENHFSLLEHLKHGVPLDQSMQICS